MIIKALQDGRLPHRDGKPPLLDPSLVPVLINRIRQMTILKEQVTASVLLEMVFLKKKIIFLILCFIICK
jgi:hypothetical protein